MIILTFRAYFFVIYLENIAILMFFLKRLSNSLLFVRYLCIFVVRNKNSLIVKFLN